MTITAFNGSPRKGNTYFMVENFLAGASGSQNRHIHLIKYNIQPCLGCFKCWTDTPGKCINKKDDMHKLINSFLKSDVVIMATPVYFDGMTATLKAFIDRLLPIMLPSFEDDSQGISRHKKRYEKYPQLIIMSNCGFPEEKEHFKALNLHFQKIIRNIHTKIIGTIYLATGEALCQGTLKDKKLVKIALSAKIKSYKNNLQIAGKELVKEGKISDKILKELNKPLINKFMYLKTASQYLKD